MVISCDRCKAKCEAGVPPVRRHDFTFLVGTETDDTFHAVTDRDLCDACAAKWIHELLWTPTLLDEKRAELICQMGQIIPKDILLSILDGGLDTEGLAKLVVSCLSSDELESVLEDYKLSGIVDQDITE